MDCRYCTLGRAEKRFLKAGTQIKGAYSCPNLLPRESIQSSKGRRTLAEPGSAPELSRRSSESEVAKEAIELAGQKPRVMELYQESPRDLQRVPLKSKKEQPKRSRGNNPLKLYSAGNT